SGEAGVEQLDGGELAGAQRGGELERGGEGVGRRHAATIPAPGETTRARGAGLGERCGGSRRAASRSELSGELEHGADAVLRLHQLERTVDVLQRHPVRDEGIDVDLAAQVALDELWDLVAALDAAE